MEPLQHDAYPCEQCDKIFRRKHHLKRHVLTHSRPALHLTCDQCGTAFTQKCYDRGHSGSKEFKCRLCQKSYTRKVRLSNHMKKYHLGERMDMEVSRENAKDPNASPSLVNEIGPNEAIQGSSLPAPSHAHDQMDTSQNVIDISDSEDDDNPKPTQPVSPAAYTPGTSMPNEQPQGHPSHPTFNKPTRSNIKATLPKLRPVDERRLMHEAQCSITIGAPTYENARSFIAKAKRSDDLPLNNLLSKLIHNFVHLYYRHFDYEYPLVHPHAMESGDRFQWIVLLAVATVGSHYTTFSNAGTFSVYFQDLLSQALRQNQPQSPETTTLSYAQAVFLYDVCLMFGGSQKAQLKLQYERNLLVTLARALKGDRCMTDSRALYAENWKAWLAKESRIRLVHCIFQIECFQLILFDRQPILGQHELPEEFPCSQTLWRRKLPSTWIPDIRSQQGQPQPAHPSPSTQIDVRRAREAMEGLDAFRRSLYMMSLYSEERLFIDKMLYSSIWNSSITSAAASAQPQEGSAPPEITPEALRTMMFRSMDAIFAVIPTSAKPDYISSRDVIHHVLCLLRQVSLQMLWSFAGWQGEDTGVDDLTDGLKIWMEGNPVIARKCLWHAVCVFSTLKTKLKFACYDPLCFLVAFFYIWAFDTIVVTSDLSKPNASTRPIGLQDTREIRIWIDEGPNTGLDLIGVGALTGRESSLRLLSQMSDIFAKRTSWAGLCRGLAKAVTQILSRMQSDPQANPQAGGPRPGIPANITQEVSPEETSPQADSPGANVTEENDHEPNFSPEDIE